MSVWLCVYKYLMCVSERLIGFVLECLCVCVWYLPLPPAPVTAPAFSYHAADLKSNKCFILILLTMLFMIYLPSLNSALAAGTSAVIATLPLSCTSRNHLIFFNNFSSFFLSIHLFFFSIILFRHSSPAPLSPV